MKFDNDIRKKIGKSVVRIFAEHININWNIPYLLNNPSRGQGTGFFINNSYILTCSHVVQNSENVYIEIPDISSQKIHCEIVGICPHFDIALLKARNYKSKYYLPLGNSDKIKIGDEVFVVGYPVSTDKKDIPNNLKYTIGIISGQQPGFIQTDSAINPGNSGGPLFLKNKVIGINSNKLVSNGVENVGFAVPINYFKIIKNDFQKNKIIYRPNLLFEFDNTDDKIVKNLTKNKISDGIIVSKIYKGSDLYNSKLKKGCIIFQIGEYKINNYGLSNKFWLGSQINIDVLLNLFQNNSKIKIKYFNQKTLKIESIIVKLNPYKSPFKSIFPVFEEIKYFILCGMIFMNFSMNHFENNSRNNISTLCTLYENKDAIKPMVFISYIFPNTYVNILNNLEQNNFINKVNNIKVHSLDDLIKAVMKPVKINGNLFVIFEENQGFSSIIAVEEIIKQDIIFSKIYKYPLNKFHKKFGKLVNK